jgi:hypothetical protein
VAGQLAEEFAAVLGLRGFAACALDLAHALAALRPAEPAAAMRSP